STDSDSGMEVGLRVVRGPDWKWGNQDDSEGHVGTVVEIGKPGSLSTPDKTVVVQWDSGSRTNYRIGYQGAYDLRVFDNAPIGVRHPNMFCNACKKHGIAGMRWKCLDCENYNLCTSCYMSDKHDLNHVFARFETNNSIGFSCLISVEMTKRSSKNAVKIQARGIFVGARVVRGCDWDWGNQDGGEGKIGKVIDIRGWDNESRRSVANVMWASGSTNVYRLGHKGKVDLKYVIDASGGYYYRDHLPVLGQSQAHEQSPQKQAEAACGTSALSPQPISCIFNVGDKVKVTSEDENDLKAMQEGHGGWNPRMAQFIGQIGTVHRVTDRGDIRVQFEGCHNRWTFNPEALVKVTSYSIGDIVRIIEDLGRVKELQKSHGEWIDLMKGALGKMGKVVKVYADGDLRVTVDGQTWTFNPLCVTLLPGSLLEMNNTMVHHQQQREDVNPRIGHLLDNQHQQVDVGSTSQPPHQAYNQITPRNKEAIVRESAQGKLDIVKEILKYFPEAVDYKSSGKTALQVAAHQGHLEVVKLLLTAKAKIDAKDDDGDTALHYAAFGNQPEILELLLKSGANVDAVNKTKCSALHIAVNKGLVNCVSILVKYGCNVNLQDNYGDTALHDAIGKNLIARDSPEPGTSGGQRVSMECGEIIEILINAPRSDLTIKNKRGFNCLHQAALKGNNFAADKLIAKSRQLVDLKKEDGFSALHLATLNGHYSVVETLIINGQAAVDIVNNRKQTPLHLAVSQCHCPIIELLVSMGANCNAVDEDNDTPLHIAMFKWSEQMKRLQRCDQIIESSPAISDLLTQLGEIGHNRSLSLAVACYLIQDGKADVNVRNRSGRTPLDLIDSNRGSAENAKIKQFLMNILAAREEKQRQEREQLEAQQRAQEEQSKKDEQHADEFALGSLRIGDIIPQDVINDIECLICNEAFANVQFSPCFHQICCFDCCSKMKRCIICQQQIQKKVMFNRESGQISQIVDTAMSNNIRKQSKGERNVSAVKSALPEASSDRLRYLESKIAEIEEANSCGICMERIKNVVFLCGHGACVNCAQTLKTCHMCRKTITKKINCY
ncbi:E3 ubiquitin-protein ligase MIB2-like protein, partial [Dinothrombium tinctorium]